MSDGDDETSMACADLLDLPDFAFQETWRSMTDDARSALPVNVKERGFRRYCKLTDYVEKTTARLRREQDAAAWRVHGGRLSRRRMHVHGLSWAP